MIAKAILGLRMQGVASHELVRETALFGVRHREEWGTGLTVLAALANLIRSLPDDETYLALYKGLRNVAQDCDGQPARHARQPLDKDAAAANASGAGCGTGPPCVMPTPPSARC